MQKNEAQERIINEIDGQMIVIACPGSGKTTTLLRRIHNMIANYHIPDESILMITFTKAAAREMSMRYSRQYQFQHGVTFSTIHALCFSILKRYGGYETDSILPDPVDILFDLVKPLHQINDKGNFIKDALMDISVVKGNRIPLNQYQPQCCDDKKLFQQLFNAYEAKKEEIEKLDFDDILLKTYELLQEERDILDAVRDQFAYIHVDEYQDTNYLQRDIIYLLAGECGNLTVVGDDDQSIYGFRGARPEIMLNFKQAYPYAREIYMSTNYRSDCNIVTATSHLIRHNTMRFDKSIIASHREDGAIHHMISLTKQKEIESVCTEIERLIHNGVAPEEIAVLYRINAQSGMIAEELSDRGVPFFSNEPIANKYNHWMWRDIESYYKMANKLGRRADYLRTILHPNRFIPNINTHTVRFTAEAFIKQAYNPYQEDWKNQRTKENIQQYFQLLEYLAASEPQQFLQILKQEGGYMEYLLEYADFRNVPDYELVNNWMSYCSDLDRKNIRQFDDWFRYVSQYNLLIQNSNQSTAGVCLSTMHKSKGLEWKYVFLLDCIKDICPFIKAKTQEEVEEERRLFYVAATRAKEHLYVCSFRTAGARKIQESPFISELLE